MKVSINERLQSFLVLTRSNPLARAPEDMPDT